MNNTERSPALAAFFERLRQDFDIPMDFTLASDHPYHCRCDKCRDWWARMGLDRDAPSPFGPFSREEIEAWCEELGLPVLWSDVEDEDGIE